MDWKFSIYPSGNLETPSVLFNYLSIYIDNRTIINELTFSKVKQNSFN